MEQVTADDAAEAAELPPAFTAITVNVVATDDDRPTKLAVRTFPTMMAFPFDGVTM